MKEFEAVVLRFVPDQGSGEALNVGVAMRTVDGAYYDFKQLTSFARVTSAFPHVHAPSLRSLLRAVDVATRRSLDGKLPLATLGEALRSLVPDPDGSIQWSDPIRGVTPDAPATFAGLFDRFVDRNQKASTTRVSRSDAQVEDALVKALHDRGVNLEPHQLRSPTHQTMSREFRHCWKNGVWNCVEPISLDLMEPRSIQDKASLWVGNVRLLAPSKQDAKVILFVGLPDVARNEAHVAAEDALAALREQLGGERFVYREDQAEALVDRAFADAH